MDIVVGVCAIVLVVWGWRVLNWVWLRPKKVERWLRQHGLNGNPYRLLFGDLKEMSAMLKEAKSKPMALSDDIIPRILPLQHKCVQKYGKQSFIWLGPKPTVHIMDPERIRDIMSNYNDFHRPKENPFFRLLSVGLVDIEREEWAKHRKIVNPAFHLEKIKNLLPAVSFSCSEMMKKWEKKVATERGCEMDVWPELQTLSADVISRTAFGSSYEEGGKLFELLRELAELVIQVGQSVYIPGWWFLPTARNRRMKQIDREAEALLRAIVDKGEKALAGGKSSSPNGELLSLLLESNLSEVQLTGSKKDGLSIKDVIGECKLFYFAGQETTSVLLAWTMVLLSRHPIWQTRAREEVRQVFGSNDIMDYDGLNRLKIVNMILHEVLRLYPPVVILSRVTAKETKVGGLRLPAGMRLSLPTIMLHHDREMWGEDAKDFNPERFRGGVSKATDGQAAPFFPFGWGPRICVGQSLAMMEAKVALSMILQRFSFQLSPSYVHAPCSVITLQPQHGAHLILHKLI